MAAVDPHPNCGDSYRDYRAIRGALITRDGRFVPRMMGSNRFSSGLCVVRSSVEQRTDRVGEDRLMSMNLADLVGVPMSVVARHAGRRRGADRK
jgi:hypothetical protein